MTETAKQPETEVEVEVEVGDTETETNDQPETEREYTMCPGWLAVKETEQGYVVVGSNANGFRRGDLIGIDQERTIAMTNGMRAIRGGDVPFRISHVATK